MAVVQRPMDAIMIGKMAGGIATAAEQKGPGPLLQPAAGTITPIAPQHAPLARHRSFAGSAAMAPIWIEMATGSPANETMDKSPAGFPAGLPSSSTCELNS